MGKQRRLLDEYRFPGYRPRADIQGVFEDPRARVIRLERAQKKRFVAVVVRVIGVTTLAADVVSALGEASLGRLSSTRRSSTTTLACCKRSKKKFDNVLQICIMSAHKA